MDLLVTVGYVGMAFISVGADVSKAGDGIRVVGFGLGLGFGVKTVGISVDSVGVGVGATVGESVVGIERSFESEK